MAWPAMAAGAGLVEPCTTLTEVPVSLSSHHPPTLCGGLAAFAVGRSGVFLTWTD
eukprot:m.265876 g.265876  ORF g.265876 m.265876 type:complete len:55 (-) comp30604_c0_seq1:1-165(-)